MSKKELKSLDNQLDGTYYQNLSLCPKSHIPKTPTPTKSTNSPMPSISESVTPKSSESKTPKPISTVMKSTATTSTKTSDSSLNTP